MGNARTVTDRAAPSRPVAPPGHRSGSAPVDMNSAQLATATDTRTTRGRHEQSVHRFSRVIRHHASRSVAEAITRTTATHAREHHLWSDGRTTATLRHATDTVAGAGRVHERRTYARSSVNASSTERAFAACSTSLGTQSGKASARTRC